MRRDTLAVAHTEREAVLNQCVRIARAKGVRQAEEQITSHKKLMLGDYSSPLISAGCAPPERGEYKRKKEKTPAAKAAHAVS